MEIIELGIPAVHMYPNKKEYLRDVEEQKIKIIFSSGEEFF